MNKAKAELNEEIWLDRDYHGWKPVSHRFIKHENLRQKIHGRGYAVESWLNKDQVRELKKLYTELHKLDVEGGGMFYSLYSRDLDYRLKVHAEISHILTPVLEQHFEDYKNVVNSFVVKAPGPQSEFYVHQDTTALNEKKHSMLSLWIPLQDVDEYNGGLSLVEKTHWLLSPYRGASFPFPFQHIQETVRAYLKPIRMKVGEVLVFDPRVIHNSSTNSTERERIALVCGLFPKEASFETCWKDQRNPDAAIELFQHEDDYLLKYPHFFYNCHDRPITGEKIGEVPHDFPDITSHEFIAFCEQNGIVPNKKAVQMSSETCQMIAEPDGVNRYNE